MLHAYATRVSSLALALAFAAYPQSNAPLKGIFALQEQGVLANGQEFAALGALSFDGNGNVKGTQTLKGLGGSTELTLSGTYQTDTDGSYLIALLFPTTTPDGDTVNVAVNYRLVQVGATMRAIRTDVGIVSDLSLQAVAAPADGGKGQYVMTETTAGAPTNASVTLQTLNLDGNGKVTGHSITKGFGPEATQDFTGNYSIDANGFGTLTLQSTSVTPDGDPTVSTRTYRFVLGANRQIEAIRIDPGVVTDISF